MEEVINGILIREVETKNIMTKSSLPVGGYSVNPYVGCTHACNELRFTSSIFFFYHPFLREQVRDGSIISIYKVQIKMSISQSNTL